MTGLHLHLLLTLLGTAVSWTPYTSHTISVDLTLCLNGLQRQNSLANCQCRVTRSKIRGIRDISGPVKCANGYFDEDDVLSSSSKRPKGRKTARYNSSLTNKQADMGKHEQLLENSIRREGDDDDDVDEDDDDVDEDDEFSSGKFQIANNLIPNPTTLSKRRPRKNSAKVTQLSTIDMDSDLDTSSFDEFDEEYIYNTSTSSTLTPSPSPSEEDQTYTYNLDETRRKLLEQQKQIDYLMTMVMTPTQKTPELSTSNTNTLSKGSKKPQKRTSPSPSLPDLPYDDLGENELMEEENIIPNFSSHEIQRMKRGHDVPLAPTSQPNTQLPPSLIPLKAMLFIDGTWLYYSLHRRSKNDCPIIRKFGLGWQYNYEFDWAALPRVICEELVKQESNKAWTSTGNLGPSAYNIQRPVEIVRASVFTSYFKTTDPFSFRVRMYNDMRDANYDIHQMETVGPGEKCVDIQLAVEMLHYATVTNAYDVAILLSGDKDFIPAMVRTRQKGRKVAVVSMRAGCNRALYESSHIKDYDVVWIDDLLDKLIIPIKIQERQSMEKKGILSVFTVSKVLYDFIINGPVDMVSSRDVGRYLKGIEIDENTTMLEDLKNGIGGLSRLVLDEAPSIFEVRQRSVEESRTLDPRDKSYLIGIKSGASKELEDMIVRTEFSVEEKNFLRKYWANETPLSQGQYSHTQHIGLNHDLVDTNGKDQTRDSGDDQSEISLERTSSEWSTLTVAILRDMCRDKQLPVTGKKADLIERLQKHSDNLETEKKLSSFKTKTTISPLFDHSPRKLTAGKTRRTSPVIEGRNNSLSSSYLEGLIKEYLKASGGTSTSNNIGRYLSANSPSGHIESKDGQKFSSALQELKECYGSLATFVKVQDDTFETLASTDGDVSSTFSFAVKLRDNIAFKKSS